MEYESNNFCCPEQTKPPARLDKVVVHAISKPDLFSERKALPPLSLEEKARYPQKAYRVL